MVMPEASRSEVAVEARKDGGGSRIVSFFSPIRGGGRTFDDESGYSYDVQDVGFIGGISNERERVCVLG